MDGLKQELRDELPEDLPLALQEEIVDTVTGESSLPIDRGLEVVLRPVDKATFTESHAHATDGNIVFHLTPEDAREFDEEVVSPVLIGEILNGEIDFETDYSTEDCV